MTDVRLVATNPEDSTLVPVASNSRGELLTQAPVIEKIPNDVEIDGDLQVNGSLLDANGNPITGGGGIELPPDPYEGAFLCWLNGELAWFSGSPVVVPEDLFGPVTKWSTDDSLLVSQEDVPPQINTGVNIIQTDAYGVPNNPHQGWQVAKQWTDCVDGFTKFNQWNVSDAFNPYNTNIPLSTTNYSLLGLDLRDVGSVTVHLSSAGSDVVTFKVIVNGADEHSITGNDSVFMNNPLTVPVRGQLNSLSFDFGGYYHGSAWKILVDDQQMVDYSWGKVTGRVNNRLDDKQLLVIPTNNHPFSVGSYLRVPQQKVAAWVVSSTSPEESIL